MHTDRYATFRSTALARRRTRGLVAKVRPLAPQRPRVLVPALWTDAFRAFTEKHAAAMRRGEPMPQWMGPPRVFVRGEEHLHPGLRFRGR